MAQPNVNREPTMEEILASIRRIIESNDTGSPAEIRPDEPDGSESEDVREADVMLAPEPPLAAATATIGSSFSALPASGTDERPAHSKPVSLADVAARVRASGGATPFAAPRSAPALAPRGNAAVRVEPRFDELQEEQLWADDEDFAEQVAANDRGIAARAESAAAPQPASAERHADEAGLEASLHDALSAAVEPEADGVAAKVEAKTQASEQNDATPERDDTDARAGTHLMSASTGAKVAAAFGDLNDVFEEGPKRSFDEMAEEMLRPMLQQWLDDNLPTLVERLVREEIERVARGNRR